MNKITRPENSHYHSTSSKSNQAPPSCCYTFFVMSCQLLEVASQAAVSLVKLLLASPVAFS